MENPASQTAGTIRLIFWRAAAGIAGWAVLNRARLLTTVKFAPLALAGALAYLLGRLVGALLIHTSLI